MPEKHLEDGGVYRFRSEQGNLIVSYASDYSQATTIFKNNVKITGSLNDPTPNLTIDGSLVIDSISAKPVTINTGGTGKDAAISFEDGGHKWHVGILDAVDKFRITNGSVLSSTPALTIDSSNRIGIGDESPSYKLDVTGDGRFTTNLIVDGKLQFNDVDDEDVIQIAQSGNTYGYIKWYDSNSGNVQAAWIGHDAGNNRFTIKVKHEGGDNESKYFHFQENGDALFPGNITVTSDVRLKENIRILENPLDQILQLNGVRFNWKHGTDKKDHIGFIAQEVERIIPEVVITSKVTIEEDESMRVDNQKSVAYQNIVPVLVEAIKELSDKVEALEKRLGN